MEQVGIEPTRRETTGLQPAKTPLFYLLHNLAEVERVELPRRFLALLFSRQFSLPVDLHFHNLVLSTGNDPVSLDYQSSALPLS